MTMEIKRILPKIEYEALTEKLERIRTDRERMDDEIAETKKELKLYVRQKILTMNAKKKKMLKAERDLEKEIKEKKKVVDQQTRDPGIVRMSFCSYISTPDISELGQQDQQLDDENLNEIILDMDNVGNVVEKIMIADVDLKDSQDVKTNEENSE